MRTANRIRNIREQYGESMEVFGLRFKPPASKGCVSNWENGYNLPNSKRLSEIAEMGNTTVEELLTSTPLHSYSDAELIEELSRRRLIKNGRLLDFQHLL